MTKKQKKLVEAGIGHPWPESLYAVIRAAGGDTKRAGEALGIRAATLRGYRRRDAYPIWEHSQRKFRLRGWGDYELPEPELTRPQTDTALAWLKGVHGNGAGDDDATTPENIGRPSVASQRARVVRESAVYDVLVAHHMARDAKGPTDANRLAFADVERYGLGVIEQRIHRCLQPIPPLSDNTPTRRESRQA